MALLSQLRWQEGVLMHYPIFCSWSFVVADLLSSRKNYDSNAWVLFQVNVSITFCSISGWLHGSKQLKRYIKKMQHFWTVSSKVKDRGQLNIGYNAQEVWEIQAAFLGLYCVFSGLHDNLHFQEFPVKVSKVQHLVKNQTKQPL
jgi:hypothetical protein